VTKSNHPFLKILQVLLYSLAAIILLLGIFGGISLVSMSSALPNSLISLQVLGLGVFVDLLTGLLGPVLINLGIGVLVIALVMSLLAFSAGRLLGITLELDQRLEIQARQLDELRNHLIEGSQG
jgi:hypothetical protein